MMTGSDITSGTPQWYAVFTRSRHEQTVRRQLAEKSIEVFLPTVLRWSRWKDRRKKVEWPLFPGYCFARFDAADSLAVRACSGTLRIVSFDGRLAPVPESQLDSIRVLVQSDIAFDPCAVLREGAAVEVLHGPLRGVTGRLLRSESSRAIVVLAVDLIGCAIRVEVDAADIAVR
jgi:transcription antitermination factor NusG